MAKARNEACSCGSGKKFKNCCGKEQQGKTPMWGRVMIVIIALVVIGGLATAVVKISEASDTPEPWEYDAANNRHWNPLPDHQHWHDGPPPAGQGNVPTGINAGLPNPAAATTAPVQAPTPTPTPEAQPGDPEAWEYDAENDQHWNPEARQWEQGMPPLEAFTSEP